MPKESASAPAETSGQTVVFVDIDGTLSHANPTRPERREPSNPLAGLLMKRGMGFDEAQESARRAEAECKPTPGGIWPFGADRELGIADGELAAHTTEVFQQRYALHPDAVRFMRGLRAIPGLRIYPATTNPRLFILGKLASGGLADAAGTTAFDDCYGGEEISPGGKCGPGFYHALCARTNTHPADCFMVGDEVVPDLDYARQAGLERVFIVCRTQAEPFRRTAGGGMFVNTLDVALSMIKSGRPT